MSTKAFDPSDSPHSLGKMSVLQVVAVVWLVALEWILAEEPCIMDRLSGDGPGPHVRVNATCFSDDSVEYQWEPINKASNLAHINICYSCVTGTNQTTDGCTEIPEGSSSMIFPASSCVFGGCYVHSVASENYPTFAISSATCTSVLKMSSHLSTSSLASSSSSLHRSTVVASSSLQTSSVSPTPTAPLRRNQGEPDILITLSVIVAAFVLSVIFFGALLLVWKKRSPSTYRFREKINRRITNEPYDHSAPDPVNVHVDNFTLPDVEAIEVQSLYNYLYNHEESGLTQNELQMSSEEVPAADNISEQTGGGDYVANDDSRLEHRVGNHESMDSLDLSINIMAVCAESGDGFQPELCQESYNHRTLSPTFSDQSGYVHCF